LLMVGSIWLYRTTTPAGVEPEQQRLAAASAEEERKAKAAAEAEARAKAEEAEQQRLAAAKAEEERQAKAAAEAEAKRRAAEAERQRLADSRIRIEGESVERRSNMRASGREISFTPGVASAEQCEKKCAPLNQCVSFTFNKNARLCYLYS